MGLFPFWYSELMNPYHRLCYIIFSITSRVLAVFFFCSISVLHRFYVIVAF